MYEYGLLAIRIIDLKRFSYSYDVTCPHIDIYQQAPMRSYQAIRGPIGDEKRGIPVFPA